MRIPSNHCPRTLGRYSGTHPVQHDHPGLMASGNDSGIQLGPERRIHTRLVPSDPNPARSSWRPRESDYRDGSRIVPEYPGSKLLIRRRRVEHNPTSPESSANKKRIRDMPGYTEIYRDIPGYSGMRPRRLRPMIVGGATAWLVRLTRGSADEIVDQDF